MITATPLALLKSHLNVDHDLDDALLEHKLAAAETWVTCTIEPTYLGGGLPAPVTEAILQLAALWYEQREAVAIGVSVAPIPFSVHDLLRPYREAVTGHVAQ
ncbi:head-tail connector protein [Defluviimonas sp. D31]|uniref:head-tail connector protein n=1 Tax=Defluviimonas sp. D31 TaxID=3083253 RepID=UPI00296E4916|nr:head-tail connector protein [Defluviimonas sp. D31]MDW4548835.1 head-tail connector protein [Defluviimonas sp. D31]